MSVDLSQGDLPQRLLDTLQELDYIGHEGLVVGGIELSTGPKDYIWRDLRNKVGLDAAFFKDGVPLIGFTGEDSPQGLAGIRRRLWNYGSVPVLISADSQSTRAYNAISYSNRQKSTTGQLGEAAPSIQKSIASQLSEAFQRADVESGAFAATYSAAYRRSKRVDAALLNNLQYLRTRSSRRGTPQRAAIDALIAGSLTAVYLSQRDILSSDYLSNISGYADVNEILASGSSASRHLFEGLADRFNGDIFGPLPDLIPLIDESVFWRVASLLRGDDLRSGQMALWPYDFRVLPVDLVSSIYEQLLQEIQRVNSAYYTPRFLVNMILDEVIPWGGVTRLKIADMACGSGAFMTEAFGRLCYNEERRMGRSLSYNELQEILKTCIFGVDINPTAAQIAVFGLYLGLLEQLDAPTPIGDSGILPTLLDRNVVVADAFEEHSLTDGRFDVVVGNPPWQSRLTAAARSFTGEHGYPVADNQLASAFLWLGAHMLRPGGTLGLVMPAKPLLHNRSEKAEQFRLTVFDKLNVRVIADLSAVRRQVFRNATGPAAIIVGSLADPDQEPTPEYYEILYVSAHPRPPTGTVDALTITPEEVRGISHKQAESRPEIWSTLLWGTVRDLELIDRLRVEFRSLDEIADERGWTRGQGYQLGGGDANDAAALQGLPIIPTTAVLPLRISPEQFERFTFPTLHRPRNIKLYKAPHVLVRRTIVGGEIAAALVEEDAAFSNGIIGISGPNEDKAVLATVTAILSSSLNRYWQFMTSASWGKERDFVERDEYLSLPMVLPAPETAQEFLELSRAAREGPISLDLVDGMVFDLYQFDTEDRNRVQNFITHEFPRFQEPRKWYSNTTADDWLEAYSRTLAGSLQDTFQGASVQSVFGRRGNYCTVAITINGAGTGSTEAGTQIGSVTIDADQIIQALQSNTHRDSTGIFALPAGFFVFQNTIYIVKTSDKDRWSRDAALDDADRIFAALAFRR
jgi:hypothetical protein